MGKDFVCLSILVMTDAFKMLSVQQSFVWFAIAHFPIVEFFIWENSFLFQYLQIFWGTDVKQFVLSALLVFNMMIWTIFAFTISVLKVQVSKTNVIWNLWLKIYEIFDMLMFILTNLTWSGYCSRKKLCKLTKFIIERGIM